MKAPFSRHEKNLLLIAAALLFVSNFARFGHWSHSSVAPTLVLFGLTFGIAAIAQYHKRTKAAPQPPQTPPPGPPQRP
ncbi:hypothetical protein EJV47_20905 [Hymenobacter gummosus]|uniref:DUF3188 domain-containing protein n=1 Tax=Hymenobacter gummosus TaxID=1776032 RepID=A0A3S0J7H3_9BACT|nr:hypothetical protein [Hymenobacter gummosus]RTQ46834.1 hypothetical protein EJV47_20905 [Hymenobacter gummosus]